jgi:hypothetical protein
MTAKDQLKVLKKGFFIIREDKENLTIKAKTLGKPNWHVLHDGFKTYAELQRKKIENLKLEFCIED